MQYSGKPLVLQAVEATNAEMKRPPCMASTFLKNCASITMMDLGNSVPGIYHESNLVEARLEII